VLRVCVRESPSLSRHVATKINTFNATGTILGRAPVSSNDCRKNKCAGPAGKPFAGVKFHGRTRVCSVCLCKQPVSRSVVRDVRNMLVLKYNHQEEFHVWVQSSTARFYSFTLLKNAVKVSFMSSLCVFGTGAVQIDSQPSLSHRIYEPSEWIF
jgi:hypothetical protein